MRTRLRTRVLNVCYSGLLLFYNSLLPVIPDEQILPFTMNKLNLCISYQDFYLSSFRLPIEFKRIYNSSECNEVSSFGYGWSHNFDISLYKKSNHILIFKDGQSRRYIIKRALDGSFVLPLDLRATLQVKNNEYRLSIRDNKTYLFNKSGRLICIEKGSNKIFLNYDKNLLLEEVTTSSGAWLKFSYDEEGRISEIVNHYSRRLRYTYDSADNLIQVEDSFGKKVGYKYDGRHRLVALIDMSGRKTVFKYDKIGNLVEVIDPKGNKTNYKYISSGYYFKDRDKGIYFPNTVIITDALGKNWSVTYNDLGKPLSYIDPKGRTTSYAWDEFGNLLSVKDPAGSVCRFIYDKDSNLIQYIDALGNKTRYVYDNSGRLIEVVKPNRSRTIYEYDQRDNLISITDPTNLSVRFTYTPEGALKEFIDKGGKKTIFSYNIYGQIDRIKDPYGGITEYVYNDFGELKKIRDAYGDEKTIHYDWNKNKIEVIYPNNDKYLYIFNDAGFLITAQSPEYKMDISYDENNMPIEIEDSYGNTIRYKYDALGRRKEMVDPLGRTTRYFYDAVGNLTHMVGPDGKKIIFEYDKLNRCTRIIYPNNIEVTYSYNQVGDVTNIRCIDLKSKKVIYNVSYTYDSMGYCISKRDDVGTTRYRYDMLGRLIDVLRPDGSRIIYEYDNKGDIISKIYRDKDSNASEKETFMYDRDNRVISYNNNINYYFDIKGNLVVKEEQDRQAKFIYNFDNLLKEIIYPDGRRVSFGYDPIGRRIWKSKDNDKIEYVYDLTDVLFHIDKKKNHIVSYINGPGVDDILSLLNHQDEKRYFFIKDNVGSTIGILDHKGDLIDKLEYEPFGRLSPSISSKSLVTPFLFTGREYDSETGLYYFRMRYYSPALGRFISKDPLLTAGFGFNEILKPPIIKKGDGLSYLLNTRLPIRHGGVNDPYVLYKNRPYEYCFNNPINFVDPWGLFTFRFRGFSITIRPHRGGVDIAVATPNIGRGYGPFEFRGNFQFNIYVGIRGRGKGKVGPIAQNINSQGGINPAGVPEPNTLALTGMGLAFLYIYKRRRKYKRKGGFN